MTKLTNPLMSFKAQGRIGQAVTLLWRGKRQIVEVMPLPHDARTNAQLSWRHMYQKAVALWHALSPEEKQEWEALARRKQMTGFAWFMSQCLKPNPGIYLPLQGGKMQGDIDTDSHKITGLPTPVQDHHAATKKYVDDSIMPPYTAGARLYRTGGLNIPVWPPTRIPWQAARYQVDILWYPDDYPDKPTILIPGVYYISATLQWEPNGVGERGIYIVKNDTVQIARTHQHGYADMSGCVTLSTSYKFAVDDTVDLYFFQSSGGNLALWAGAEYTPEFTIQRIG